VGAVSSITVNASPTIAVSNYTICNGSSVVLVPTGASTFTYSGGSATVSPISNTTYSITGTSTAGCVGTNTALSAVTVNTLPIVSAAGGTICNGQSFTLAPTGASSYTYQGGSAVVSPTSTTSYTVSGTDAQGCVSATAAVASITVFALPTLSLSGGSICPGNSFTLVPSGAATYTYLNGGPVVTPAVTTSYSVTGTSSLGCPATNTVVAVLTVTNTLVVNITGSANICSGLSATLTANGASTYSWSNGATTASISVSPSVNTSYTAYGTSGTCSNNAAVTVTVNTTPTVSIAGTNTVCSGSAAVLTASGANSYSWSTAATTASISVNPTVNISYSVVGTSTDGCSASATKSLTVFAVPILTVNSGSICSGQSFVMNPSGAFTYSFSSGTATVSPLTTSSYSVSGTSTAGCVSNTSAISNVTVNITPTVFVSNGTICAGQSFTINPSGANVYAYSSGTNVVSPISNTSYSVTGTSAQGCASSNTAVVAVTVNTVPIISVNSGSICSGGSFVITPSGAASYSITGNSFTVSPATNTTYVITGIGANGCLNNTGSISQITVNANPTVGISNATICPGNSYVLTPTGASTYVYLNGGPSVTPAITTSYSVTGTSTAGCAATNTAVAVVTVSNSLSVGITGSANICSGNSATLTGTGATTYSWSTSATTASVSVSPLSNTTYTVYGVTGTCSNNAVVTVTVNTTPTISIAGTNTMCVGANVTYTASGANTYSWNTGALTSTLTQSPATNTNYTVTGTSGAGCSATASVITSVFVLPTITVNSGSVCVGQVFTITPSGANTYTYSGGSATVSPISSSNYSVTGTSTAGCLGSAVISSVTVNATPTISANSGSICAGGSFVIVPSGAASYVFSGGSATVNPAVTTTYSVTGTSSLGCAASNTALSTVSVIANPVLTITASSASVCLGNSSTLTVSGANSYTWQTGVNTNSINVTPVLATSYSVIGASAVGCINTASQTIGLFPNPTITISSSSASVCIGFSSTINAGGANTYTWSTGANTSAIVVSPTVTSSYTVNSTDLNGCITNTSVVIALNPQPTLTAVAINTGVCLGLSTNLVANGASTYTWNANANTSTIAVSPTIASTYSVTGSNGAGCLSSTTVSIAVYANPTVNIGANVQVGLGGNFSFNPTQSLAATYSWSPVDFLSSTTISNPLVTPLSDITYTLMVSSANGCTATSTVNVTVLTELIIANYMSPNGDGANDTWKVNVPVLIKDFSITIIDSYGRTVYSKDKEYNNEFDGRLNGDDLPDGTYYYFIKDGTKVKYKGSITLTK
jgi:gliding motility-associated-like protein